MKKIALLLACLMFAFSLAACTNGGTTITVYNWEDYIDPDVIALFEEETGISVKYERFTTNEEMYIKLVRTNSSYDIVFPSDYLIERFIKEDVLEPLDKSKLPNLNGLMPLFSDPQYDPGNTYSAPYMWGTVGILYNTTMTEGPIDSWDAMWDLKYKNNVLMMASIRDTLGVTLKKLGYSLNDTDPAHLEEAKNALLEQRDTGVLLSYMVDEIKTKMVNEEAALGLVWSGDAVTSIEQNPDLVYVVPKEGSNVWVDGMVIPKNSKNKDAAHEFINFMTRPDIALANSRYIGFSTPSAAARNMMSVEEQEDEVFNPTQAIIDRCEFMHDLGDSLDEFDRIWTEIKAD